MNDFLQSLRTGNTKPQRTGMTRKTYDYTFHSANQQFQYKSTSFQPDQDTGNRIAQDNPAQTAPTSILLNTIENLSKQIEKLTENQGLQIAAQKKTAHVIERQTIAMEKIMNHLELLPQ